MTALTEREQWDIQKVLEDKDCFASMPERHRTAAVSMVAVFQSAHNLEYVPEAAINKDICRMALSGDGADCTILPLIPYPDIQKEGIKKFSENTPAFVLYSFADIQDGQIAHEAVKADAYCIQLIPDCLLTKNLCREALKSPDMDEKMMRFVTERFPDLKTEQSVKGDKAALKSVKMKI